MNEGVAREGGATRGRAGEAGAGGEGVAGGGVFFGVWGGGEGVLLKNALIFVKSAKEERLKMAVFFDFS
jgi:hypothetical protein